MVKAIVGSYHRQMPFTKVNRNTTLRFLLGQVTKFRITQDTPLASAFLGTIKTPYPIALSFLKERTHRPPSRVSSCF